MAMSEKTENLLAKLLHFGVLAVTAWTIITVDFTGRGSILSQLKGKEPSAADRNALAAPTKSNLQRAEGGDRSLIVAEERQAAPAEQRERALTAAELAAQVPALQGQPAAGAKTARKLNSTLADLNDPSRRASQQTSAGMSGSAYIEASAVASPSPAGATYSNEPPSEDARPQRRAVASRYSSNGRSDMMGNSGGSPTYNIKGKNQ